MGRDSVDLPTTSSGVVEVKSVADRALGRQFFLNSVFTALFYGFSLVIGLWYTRFTIHSLGIAMQAIIPVASSFIAYMMFVTNGISGSVGRFVVADVARGDMAAANRTFNTFLVATERVSLILLAAIAGIVWFVVPHLDYPPGQLNVTRFVFTAILGSGIIQVWSMCFDSAIWVSGRIDIRNMILIVETGLRVATVYVLFTVSQPNLLFIGVACLVAPVGSFLLYFLAWKKLTPEFTINRKLFDIKRFGEIRNMGGWLLVLQIGGALQLNADMILLNVMLGREIQGSYGVMLAWVNILRGLFMSMGALISPSLAAFQASEETDKAADLSIRSVRMQGLLIAVPVGVLCGLAGPALNWWLGPAFTFLSPLAWLILVPLAIEGSFYPVGVLIQLPKTIPFSAMITVALGVINVVLGIVLVKFTDLGMYGIAYAVAITSFIRHGVVLPMYVARLLKRPWYTLLQQQSQTVIQLGLTGAISLYAAHFLTGRSLPQLVLVALLAGGVASIFALLQLNQSERMYLLKLVRRR